MTSTMKIYRISRATGASRPVCFAAAVLSKPLTFLFMRSKRFRSLTKKVVIKTFFFLLKDSLTELANGNADRLQQNRLLSRKLSDGWIAANQVFPDEFPLRN